MTALRRRVWLGLLLASFAGVSALFLPTLAGISVYEVGDLAGDMLQADAASRSGRWFFGHHSDVGVRHPGPAGLLLKHVFSGLASAGVFGSVFGSSVAAVVMLRVLLLLAVLFFLAKASGSTLAPVAFLLPLLLLLPSAPMGPLSAWLHFVTPFVAFALVAGWAAFALDPDEPPLLLLLASGLGSHLHAPLMPVALPLLLLASFVTLRTLLAGRRARTLVPSVLAAFFVLPLVVRVFAESRSLWPLSYLEAARSRAEAQSAFFVPDRPRFFFLEQYSGLDGDTAAALLLLTAVSVLLLLVLDRRRRMLWSGLAWLFSAASTTMLLSDPQQSLASEMLWVSGMPAAAAGLLAGGLLLIVVRRGPRLLSRLPSGALSLAFSSARLSPLFSILVLLPLLGALPPAVVVDADGHGGMLWEYVPDAADLFVSSGADAVQLSQQSFFSAEAGLVLELRRRGVDFCVQPAVASPPNFVEELGWFFLPEDLCDFPAEPRRMLALTPGSDSRSLLEFDAGFAFRPVRFSMAPVCTPMAAGSASGPGGLWDGC